MAVICSQEKGCLKDGIGNQWVAQRKGPDYLKRGSFDSQAGCIFRKITLDVIEQVQRYITTDFCEVLVNGFFQVLNDNDPLLPDFHSD